MRKLGIPTALDRFIQQEVGQVLQARWDPTFSERIYGFRPRRSAHQAVAQAQKFQAEGFRWVVDLDLEKFFDRLNHDRLMSRVAERRPLATATPLSADSGSPAPPMVGRLIPVAALLAASQLQATTD